MSARTKLSAPVARLALCLVAASLLLAVPAGAAKKPWQKMKFPELGDVHIPQYNRYELENGMVVYLLESHEWPLVEGRILVRTGSAYEPVNKVGLASITGTVLRTGGTTKIAADDLDELLEGMGAFIESSIGETQGRVGFSFLSKDASRGLELVRDVLRSPAFEDDKIDIAKNEQRAGIARRNDELSSIRQRELMKAVWGPDHPYARTTEYATIDAITRDDVVSYYKRFYHPNHMMVAVWGDFDESDMLASLRELFEDWPAVDLPVPPLPEAPAEGERRVLVANKEDVTQTSMAMGHVGMKASDPDYYAMSVLNRILGGGFSSRLFSGVRSKQGLAYSVGSRSGVGLAHPGVFLAGVGTKSATTEKALGAVLHEIERVREEPVTDAELRKAKDAILNSHVFNFERASQVLTRLQTYEYYGYPADFLETYVDHIRHVTKDDVLDVAKRRIHPDQFAIVAVGKVSEWDGDLSAYGPVEKLDISIPEPEGEEFPQPTAETVEEGRAILASAQSAAGGRAVTGLKRLRLSESVALSMGGMEMSATAKLTFAYPDHMLMTFQLPFGEMVQAVDGDQVWVKSPQGIQEVTGAQAEDMRNNLVKDPLYILGHFDQYQVQALPPEKVEDATTQVVLVRIGDDDWLKMYFDASSHDLVKTATMAKDMMTGTPGLQESFYSDFRTVQGLRMAHKMRIMQAGKQQMAMEVKAVEVNPSLQTAVFSKPES